MAATTSLRRSASTFCLQEVPSIRQQWIGMHYGPRNEKFNPEAVNPTGGADCEPACLLGSDLLRYRAQLALTMSTDISTAGVVPLFSSQCVVFLSSGQPTPGP